MVKKTCLVIFLITFFNTSSIYAQTEFQEFLSYISSLEDSISKSVAVDSFINYARTKGIPFIEGDTATYIYRNNVSSVEVTGDFNEFSPYLDLSRIDGTDLFYFSDQYESNARLDYQFRINGTTVLLDPENPDSLLGYYGYKSELAMPEYIQPWEIEFNPNIPPGSVIDTSIYSSIVGDTYQLKIYLPPQYNSSVIDYPTAYFQDGFSYTDWGSTINILDNIIDAELIQPIIAVFVKPNDRNSEYAFGLRNLYRTFFVNELVPFVDSTYRTIKSASQRLVMGDSYGGNISVLISYNHPDIFGLCGLHSAALTPNDYEAYHLVVDGEIRDIKFSSVWGSYDNRNTTLINFKNALLLKGYASDWLILPEGHSWGLWRATVDTILQYFFPPQTTPIELVNDNIFSPLAFSLKQNFPNPFNSITNIQFKLPVMSNVQLKIFNILGAEVKTLFKGERPAGYYEVTFNASDLTSGIYFFMLKANNFSETRKMILLK